MMETPAFLKPIQSYPGEIVQFIERIPGVDVTGDRQTVLERLEPYHKAEVEALGWRWKDLRRAEQVHGTRVALVGDIGSNYPVEGVDGLLCSGVSDCVLAIYVADCAAVWLYDKENCHRALIHSGKAGTARQHHLQHDQVHEKIPGRRSREPDRRHFPLHTASALRGGHSHGHQGPASQ